MSAKENTFWEKIVIPLVIAVIAGVILLYLEHRTSFFGSTSTPTFSPTPTELLGPTGETSSPLTNSVQSVAQNVQWIPNSEGIGGGLCIDWDRTANCPSDKIFIPWNILKVELEKNVLPQVPGIPTGSSLMLQASSDGIPNAIIKVVDSTGKEKAHVWIGENPENSWIYDGLIRVGNPETMKIWETFVRYSNGAYLKK